MLGLAACAVPDEVVEIAVEFDAAADGLTVVVADGPEELAREAVSGRRAELSFRGPGSYDPDDVEGCGAALVFTVSVVDDTDEWHGIALDELAWCPDGCGPESDPGWYRLSPVYQQCPQPYKELIFDAELNLVPATAFSFAMPDSEDVTVLPRAVLADCCGAETVAVVEIAPGRETRFYLSDSAHSGFVADLVSDPEQGDFDAESVVPGFTALIAAIHDTDASGDWTSGDGIDRAACHDRADASVVWVEPPASAEEAYAISHRTVYRPGWSISAEPSGESPLTDAEIASLEWCAY